ncbi:MAG: hypothetical protein ACK5OX_16720, partial [Desertimonas sp.]
MNDKRTLRKPLGRVGVAAALVVGLAAWGGEAPQGADTTVPDDSAASDDSVSEEGEAGSAEVGPADESLDPVVVGFHNLEGGAISLPGIRAGFEQGVRYVNERLGGINGHPLEVEACNVDITPESSV